MSHPLRALPPSYQLLRPSRHSAIPEWETELCTAIGEGLIAKDVFTWSSATRSNLIFTSEFDLPSEITVRFESRPSQQHWGAVDISIVVGPRANTNLNERLGTILPMFSAEGARQGDVTAVSRIYDGGWVTPSIALLYVSRQFSERWQHVCGL